MKTKLVGSYIYDGKLIGIVEDFRPKKWFGKVILFGMEDFAEYGTLEPDCKVIADGKTYTYENRSGRKE